MLINAFSAYAFWMKPHWFYQIFNQALGGIQIRILFLFPVVNMFSLIAIIFHRSKGIFVLGLSSLVASAVAIYFHLFLVAVVQMVFVFLLYYIIKKSHL
jgi:hypothetical protein